MTAFDLSLADLIGTDEEGLVAGFVPNRSIVYIPPMQIGDGLAGPENDQPLEIYRDNRPLAVDELGMGHLGKLARHRAGRSFPLNYQWGAGLDTANYERVPTQDTRTMSPFGPGQSVVNHDGFAAAEVLPDPGTVFFTATPQVGYTP